MGQDFVLSLTTQLSSHLITRLKKKRKMKLRDQVFYRHFKLRLTHLPRYLVSGKIFIILTLIATSMDALYKGLNSHKFNRDKGRETHSLGMEILWMSFLDKTLHLHNKCLKTEAETRTLLHLKTSR